MKLLLLAAAIGAALLVPSAAFAGATLSSGLAEQAAADPHAVFQVIVQGKPGGKSNAVADNVKAVTRANPAKSVGLKRRFLSIDGVSAELTGKQVLKLARKRGILSITVDQPVRITALNKSKQRWPVVTGAAKFWTQLGPGSALLNAPAIAVVDSGVDPSHPDLAGRVVREVDLTSLPNNSPHDGRGHGTFVASIAAGAGDTYAGVAPNVKLVSIDVIDDEGMGMTSDVIAAADWILQNKDTYNIRVANFSLHGSQPSTFRFDPLSKAVERLWFSGVVVVAAAGNYGETQGGVLYAPGSDPFVITVGATDINGSTSTQDDFAAPWSAYGYTLDGFAKPEISAPGRYMVGAVPADSALAQERPDRLVDSNHLMMSGTSFSSPIVAGTAAYILARHPGFTPDQVKGALMLSAQPTPSAEPMSTGVGEVASDRAAEVADPPNPNAALDQFVVEDPDDGAVPVFDQATWTTYAQDNPSWDAATWTTATWTTATWTTAAWDAATWASATWTTATWTTATWTTSNDATWTTSADSESSPTGDEWMQPNEQPAPEAVHGHGH